MASRPRSAWRICSYRTWISLTWPPGSHPLGQTSAALPSHCTTKSTGLQHWAQRRFSTFHNRRMVSAVGPGVVRLRSVGLMKSLSLA